MVLRRRPNFWGTDEADPAAIKTGIEYDMANAIAAACGLTMEVRNESFDAIVAGQVAAKRLRVPSILLLLVLGLLQ